MSRNTCPDGFPAYPRAPPAPPAAAAAAAAVDEDAEGGSEGAGPDEAAGVGAGGREGACMPGAAGCEGGAERTESGERSEKLDGPQAYLPANKFIRIRGQTGQTAYLPKQTGRRRTYRRIRLYGF